MNDEIRFNERCFWMNGGIINEQGMAMIMQEISKLEKEDPKNKLSSKNSNHNN